MARVFAASLPLALVALIAFASVAVRADEECDEMMYAPTFPLPPPPFHTLCRWLHCTKRSPTFCTHEKKIKKNNIHIARNIAPIAPGD